MKALGPKDSIAIFLLAIFLFIPTFSFAQEAQVIPPEDLPLPRISEGVKDLQGTVNCFDYYTFGSVQADVFSETRSVVSGTEIIFKGKITNNNTYPIVDGAVYVKIFHEQDRDSDKTHSNGYPVVDQFFAVDNLNIDANSTKDISFTWNVPSYAVSGKYHIATFFVTSKKFNLLGLSFTDDIVGNKFEFEVKGEAQGGVYFNKDAVIVDGEQYRFAAFTPKLPKNKPIEVRAVLKNATNQTEEIPVVWKVYKWDALTDSNKLAEKIEKYSVPPQGSKEIIFVLEDSSTPVYLIIAEAGYADTKSILNVRFTRVGVDQIRINFPALTSFPLEENKETTFFSCLHSMGTSNVVPEGKMVLSLEDKWGRQINELTYFGAVSGDMMGVKKDFSPKKSYDYVKLSASLYAGDTVVDSAEMIYDCNLIDNTKCSKTNWLSLAFWLVVLVVLVWIIKIIYSSRKARLVILFCLLASGAFLPSVSEAKSVVWSDTKNTTLTYYSNRFGDDQAWWTPGLANFQTSVTYNVKIIDAITQREIPDGSTVSVGSTLKFEFVDHKSADINWFGTGYSNDSPFGYWKEMATQPNYFRCGADFINSDPSSGRLINVHVALNVNPPIKKVLFSGTSQMDCLNNVCRVASPGTIEVIFDFAPTYGKFYHAYYDTYKVVYGSWSPNRDDNCYYNERAMVEGPGCWMYNSPCLDYMNSGGYLLKVPNKKITYSFSAISDNTPPLPPTITQKTTPCIAGEVCYFDFYSIDGDTPPDKIKYGISWDGDEVADQYIPANYVTSGTIGNGSKKWISAGTYTIKAITLDERGASSGWSSYMVSVVPPPPPYIDSALRVKESSGVAKIAADATLNPASPLRIMTRTGVKSIPLVPCGDPSATKVCIMTKNGPRGLLKLP